MNFNKLGYISKIDAYKNYDYYYHCFVTKVITEKEWACICFLALEYLMETNKKTLDRLKNV